MIRATVDGVPLNGGRWKVLGTAGWLDSPGFTVPSVERLRHGAFAGRGRASGRTIKLTGRVQNLTHAQQMTDRDELVGLFQDGRQMLLTVSIGDSRELSTTVQLIDQVMFEPRSVAYSVWEVSLFAEDPFIYSPWRETLLRPVDAGVGLEYPLFGASDAMTYGSAVDTDTLVWNDGNADSWPQFDVFSDSPAGFAISIGARRVTYPWATFMGVPVTIDMAGSAMVGSSDQSHMLGERGWSPIPKKSIESPELTFLSGGSGWATARHRDTYL